MGAFVTIIARGLSEIDLSHTATFGITLPDGVTYTSPLSFPGPETAAVAEPATVASLGIAVVALGLARRRGDAAAK